MCNKEINHHDGEQLGFYEKERIKTDQKEGCSLYYYRIFILQEIGNVKCHIQHEEG